MMERFILYAAVNGFLVVALGAFGAHGLEEKISEASLETWNTAVLYQMFHDKVSPSIRPSTLHHLLRGRNTSTYAFFMNLGKSNKSTCIYNLMGESLLSLERQAES